MGNDGYKHGNIIHLASLEEQRHIAEKELEKG